jgi:hypothetical protein
MDHIRGIGCNEIGGERSIESTEIRAFQDDHPGHEAWVRAHSGYG